MLENKNYNVKAICPNCKKTSLFVVADENEKQRFRFSRHDCPKCAKKFLSGWAIDYRTF